MATVPFDTLKAFKELQDAGFDEAQAQALVVTMGIAVGGNLATKQDVADLARDMATKQDIRDLAAKQNIAVGDDLPSQQDIDDLQRNVATKADLRAMENRLTIRLGVLMIALYAIIIIAVIPLP